MYNTILVSLKINFKSLRMSALNYIMLVVIFPVSYLAIALASSNNTLLTITKVSGAVLSMLFSLFINMQATLVSGSNDITIRETYAVYGVKPLVIFISQCLFHTILSLPIIFVAVMIISFSTNYFSLLSFLLWLVLSILFLSSTSVLLGMILKNPQIANPCINLTYMMLISITPLYSPLNNINNAYLWNPLTHSVNLFYSNFGTEYVFCNTLLSTVVLLGYICVAVLLILKEQKKSYGNEKVTIL